MIPLKGRFRGFLPVVIDIETAGFNANTDAILEIAAALLRMDDAGALHIHSTHAHNITPFAGANLEPAALEFTGIDPWHPFREAKAEHEALTALFQIIRKELKTQGCHRAILVGHNAHFDAGFINAAAERCSMRRNPFHPFSHFDTATLSGLAYGHTVLARACARAEIEFDNHAAHSAAYDVEKTAQLFCRIVNRWHTLGGWVPPPPDPDPAADSEPGPEADSEPGPEADSEPGPEAKP